MPLPSDEQLMQTSRDLVSQFQSIFGKHPGFRPAHAKGILLNGKFTPSPDASRLSSAPHFNKASTPITVRFSNSTGLPKIPDADPNASPRGIAIRFNLGDHVHTDIISQSTPFFPTRTGEEFLEFLRALAASSSPDTPSPSPVEAFVGSHPAALAFVQAPKKVLSSYAGFTYYSVNAFILDLEGKATYVRYRVVPTVDPETLDEATLKTKDADFLQSELSTRLKDSPIVFHLIAQIAEDGDEVDDATVHWPESRRLVELGTVELGGLLPNSDKEQKHIIFDPIPRVQGVKPTDDPLLELRAAVYLISGRERRAAP